MSGDNNYYQKLFNIDWRAHSAGAGRLSHAESRWQETVRLYFWFCLVLETVVGLYYVSNSLVSWEWRRSRVGFVNDRAEVQRSTMEHKTETPKGSRRLSKACFPLWSSLKFSEVLHGNKERTDGRWLLAEPFLISRLCVFRTRAAFQSSHRGCCNQFKLQFTI